jgi:hypothetical protein
MLVVTKTGGLLQPSETRTGKLELRNSLPTGARSNTQIYGNLRWTTSVNHVRTGPSLLRTPNAFEFFGGLLIQVQLKSTLKILIIIAPTREKYERLTRDLSAPASMSKAAVSPCADSMARCRGVLPIFIHASVIYGYLFFFVSRKVSRTHSVTGIETRFRATFGWVE